MANYEGFRIVIPMAQVVDHEASAIKLQSFVVDTEVMSQIVNAVLAGTLSDKVVQEDIYTGVSKRTVPDEHDANLGYDLAFNRALTKMATKEGKLLDGRIRDQDFQREHAEKIKAEKAAEDAAKTEKKSKAKK